MTARNEVIVLGAHGQLGRQLVARLESAQDLSPTGYDQQHADIADPDAMRDLLARHQIAWLINCAAFTDVDQCESHAEQATRINGEAVAHLADIANEHQARFVQISTDYVFNGGSSDPYAEDAPTDPRSIYGRSKLLGEQNAANALRHLIIRTAWMFGPGGRNFVDTILSLAQAGKPLRVVNDQHGNPTYAPDLADCILRLLEVEAEGVFHVTNSGQATWYQLACKAIETAGITATVNPVSTAEYPTPAQRPQRSVLCGEKYLRITHHQPRHWTAAIDDYVRAREE